MPTSYVRFTKKSTSDFVCCVTMRSGTNLVEMSCLPKLNSFRDGNSNSCSSFSSFVNRRRRSPRRYPFQLENSFTKHMAPNPAGLYVLANHWSTSSKNIFRAIASSPVTRTANPSDVKYPPATRRSALGVTRAQYSRNSLVASRFKSNRQITCVIGVAGCSLCST